ncbi:siphovirus ReqiPepy6 Gp37-like family protein [Priestia koreensis]|uniref:siphovirus ReqiPepy6 Gp37-like family protein n=1 Tax=Priestia koreensis TaxID=284581 RepID=UPI003D024338
MDVYVFNQHFQLQGIVDSFTSLMWRREYSKTGTFELHINLPESDHDTASLIATLQKGNILVKEDDPSEAAEIESLIIEEKSDGETLVITGYFIENFLDKRIVWGEMSQLGNIEDVMKYFVDHNAINPANTKRIIPHLKLTPNNGLKKQADELSSYANLVTLIEELAVKYDVGWRIIFDLLNKQYLFDVYEGLDRSINQSINPQAIFSLEYENVLNQKYTSSNSNYKNMALVAGKGEGIEQKFVEVNELIAGFERYEVFVDAKDVTDQQDNQPISDEEYKNILKEKGNSRLSETTVISTFESGVSITSNLVYKQDFDLGDVVTIQNERWGVQLNTRITGIEEVYETDTRDIKVNFGSNIPTLIDKIKMI